MSKAEQPPGMGFTRLPNDILDHLLEGFQLIGFDWTYKYVNDAIARQGRQPKEALLGRTMMEVYPGIEATPMFTVLTRCMTERVAHRMENEFTFPSGEKGWFELAFQPVPDGVLICSADITEKKRAQAAESRMEQQLRQAQKMDAIGNLAGGIAHDFNNLLTVILSYASFIDAELPPASPLRKDLGEIRNAGERATALTRQLLSFCRRQVVKTSAIELNQVVGGMEKMLRRVIGSDVLFEYHPRAGADIVLADANQLEQVVLNLVLNARDAMPAGGNLSIETANIYLNGDYTSLHLGVPEGDYVMLAVSDSGMGMSKETQERIFEPFFTTKEHGKGTGLGLPMVYGIVKQNSGHVWVYSEPGQGTVFRLYFPRHISADSIAPLPAPQVKQLAGTETILLVEDDHQVRGAAKGILVRAGYHVVEVRNAGEAFSFGENPAQKVDLLLTDVVMPEINGVQLAQKLAISNPNMKLLCMSGYTDETVFRQGLIGAKIAFIQKPLTPELLLTKVRQVLDLAGAV